VSTTLALAPIVAAHLGGPFFFPWFLLIIFPLFWIGVFLLIGGLARRRWARNGWGPGMGRGYGRPHFNGFNGFNGGGASAAEATLAERFAQGDIDEKEYRARLEVLRANNTFTPPTAK
jgi:putative membrane protein